MKNPSKIIEALEEFQTYKPRLDNSPLARPDELFTKFMVKGTETHSVAISAFSGIVLCPYRIVNAGLGNPAVFSQTVIKSMNAGSKSHRAVEVELNKKNAKLRAAGGPSDWRAADAKVSQNASQTLLEAPEVKVKLAIDGLQLNGKVDGLLRSDGIVQAIERKPRSAMFKPASILQAMTYAIGGCVALESSEASLGAKWTVTSYEGAPGPNGSISNAALRIIERLGNAYVELFEIGSSGGDAPSLPGPGPGKCARCEYFNSCPFRIVDPKSNRSPYREPIWLKYAKKKGHKSDED